MGSWLAIACKLAGRDALPVFPITSVVAVWSYPSGQLIFTLYGISLQSFSCVKLPLIPAASFSAFRRFASNRMHHTHMCRRLGSTPFS